MKTRNKMKKLEQEKFVVPKTVQNVIPIKAVYKDGIFLVGKNMYSKTFLFTDVNYYIACENEKNDLMRQYWAVINSFGNGVTVKLTINNHRFDKEDFEKSILMPYYYDNLDVYRKEYNEMLLNKAATSECIVQDKYFTVTVNKKCYEDARAFFTRIEKNLSTNLFALGSKCEPLNATDRLKIFHNFYRAGSEENFNLDFELLQNQGCDVRDYISPDSMDFNSDYMMINGQYCRTVFLRNYGTFVDDNIITELTSINKNLMLSIDFIPIPVDEANKDVDNILLGVQSDKANFNRRQAQNQNYGATNYDLEQREKEILEIRNDMRYRDQRIYDTIISMVITADSKQELDNLTESIFAKASENSTAQFATLRYQQLDGLNTVLPFGVKRIEKKIVAVATNSAKYSITARTGYCQAWVADVYQAVTGSRGSAHCALCAADMWAVSSDFSQIPVGATVYGYSSSKYGHVGIYIGNGKVAHNIGYVKVQSLESWIEQYKGFCWGWENGNDILN